MSLGKPLSVKDYRWRKMRHQQMKILRNLYSDYDPKWHDAFLFRYTLEIWRRMRENGEEIPNGVNEILKETENAKKVGS